MAIGEVHTGHGVWCGTAYVVVVGGLLTWLLFGHTAPPVRAVLADWRVWLAVLLLLAAVDQVHYAQARGKADPLTSAQALEVPGDALRHGREPYSVHLSHDAPISPGPGWIALLLPLTAVRATGVLGMLAVAVAVLCVARRSAAGAGVFCLVLLLGPLFESQAANGQDLYCITLAMVVLALVLETAAGPDRRCGRAGCGGRPGGDVAAADGTDAVRDGRGVVAAKPPVGVGVYRLHADDGGAAGRRFLAVGAARRRPFSTVARVGTWRGGCGIPGGTGGRRAGMRCAAVGGAAHARPCGGLDAGHMDADVGRVSAGGGEGVWADARRPAMGRQHVHDVSAAIAGRGARAACGWLAYPECEQATAREHSGNMERRRVGVLGATGTVGQRFVQMLERHPWFEVAWLAASERSTGKRYADACSWKLDTPMPRNVAEMVLQPNVPGDGASLPKIIFAALDADVARELEPLFAAAGCAVISNSSAFRMTPDVPLVLPEVNADHLPLLEMQATRKNGGGYVVTNANCSAIGLVLALKPLETRFGIESLFVTTMQAVSGAGYPGVPSLDILGNVVPFIKNEEEKLQEEVGKMLGRYTGAAIDPLSAKVSAHCNRVAVVDGHTECVSIKLRTPATREQILEAWASFTPLDGRELPSAPGRPVLYNDLPDRPQPRLDVNNGNGMSTTVGRLRPCTLLDWKFVLLSHNTIRGAAGAAVLNAEVLARAGKLPKEHA